MVVENAAAARSFGSELTISARPVDGLTLGAAWGLNFTEFTEFTDSPFGDLTGNVLPNAPQNTFSLTADYEHQKPIYRDLRAFVRAEYNLRTEFGNLLDPDALTFDGFDILNLRAGLRGERFEITAFVENALNEVFATGSASAPAAAVLAIAGVTTEPVVDVGETRRFGVVGKIKF